VWWVGDGVAEYQRAACTVGLDLPAQHVIEGGEHQQVWGCSFEDVTREGVAAGEGEGDGASRHGLDVHLCGVPDRKLAVIGECLPDPLNAVSEVAREAQDTLAVVVVLHRDVAWESGHGHGHGRSPLYEVGESMLRSVLWVSSDAPAWRGVAWRASVNTAGSRPRFCGATFRRVQAGW